MNDEHSQRGGDARTLAGGLLELADSSPEEAFLRAVDCLADADENVRIAGLECLADLKRDPGSDAVARLLQDSETLVRVAALELVVALGAQTEQSLLVRLVSSDPAEVVRGYAGWALGRVGDSDALSILRSRLLVEQSAVVRSSITEALYRLTKHPPYLDMLLEELSSPDPEARAFSSNSVIGIIARDNVHRIITALRAAMAEEKIPTIAAAIRGNLETAECMQRDDDFELD